jgi:hypothetical protein
MMSEHVMRLLESAGVMSFGSIQSTRVQDVSPGGSIGVTMQSSWWWP